MRHLNQLMIDHSLKRTLKTDIKLRSTKTLYEQTPLPTTTNVVTSLYSIRHRNVIVKSKVLTVEKKVGSSYGCY